MQSFYVCMCYLEEKREIAIFGLVIFNFSKSATQLCLGFKNILYTEDSGWELFENIFSTLDKVILNCYF